MTKTYKDNAPYDVALLEELRCLRAVMERVLRVMDEGLFVDYQMEKFGKSVKDSDKPPAEGGQPGAGGFCKETLEEQAAIVESIEAVAAEPPAEPCIHYNFECENRDCRDCGERVDDPLPGNVNVADHGHPYLEERVAFLETCVDELSVPNLLERIIVIEDILLGFEPRAPVSLNRRLARLEDMVAPTITDCCPCCRESFTMDNRAIHTKYGLICEECYAGRYD